MSTRLRQCIIYLLIALLPLQAAAATRLALCAEMSFSPSSTQSTTPNNDATMQHCERMDMSKHIATDPAPADVSKSTTPHKEMGCWLGSTCVAAMLLVALPIDHAVAHVERRTPVHSSIVSHYHSVIVEGPQRPPATI